MARIAQALATSFLLCAALSPAVAEVNRIVLRINDRIATLYDYERLKEDRIDAITRARMPSERRQELLARVGEATMRDLYDEVLVLSRADQLGVTPSEQSIRDAIDRSKGSMGIDSEEQFRAALLQSSMTLEDLREQMRKSLMLQEVISREVHTQVDLQEEDLRRYYQSHLAEFELPVRLRLREIVVLESNQSTPDSLQELATSLRQRILAGSLSEEDLAASKESGRTTGWIDLGWVEEKDLDADLANAALGLAEGEISAPVAARGGLHLLQAVERLEAGVQSFKDVESKIRGKEGNRLFNEELIRYTKKLEDSSYIVIDPPPDAAGFQAATVRDDLPADGLESVLSELGGGQPATEPAAEPAAIEPDSL